MARRRKIEITKVAFKSSPKLMTIYRITPIEQLLLPQFSSCLLATPYCWSSYIIYITFHLNLAKKTGNLRLTKLTVEAS